jgi:hypothetical protein
MPRRSRSSFILQLQLRRTLVARNKAGLGSSRWWRRRRLLLLVTSCSVGIGGGWLRALWLLPWRLGPLLLWPLKRMLRRQGWQWVQLQLDIRSTAAGELQVSECLLCAATIAAEASKNEDGQSEQCQPNKRSDHSAADHTCTDGRSRRIVSATGCVRGR